MGSKVREVLVCVCIHIYIWSHRDFLSEKTISSKRKHSSKTPEGAQMCVWPRGACPRRTDTEEKVSKV
jgi:hypothetical protein